MYRISKVLNHNAVIAVSADDNQEYLLMGKGIGFGRKVTERIQLPEDASVYSLRETTKRGSARQLAASIAPECLEIAGMFLKKQRKYLGVSTAAYFSLWRIISNMPSDESVIMSLSVIL